MIRAIITLLVATSVTAFCQIKVPDLPEASSVSDSDFTIVTQGPTTRKAAISAIRVVTAANISDSTAVGRALLQVPTPGSATFLRINSDGSVSALDIVAFRSALGLSSVAISGSYADLAGAPTNWSWSSITSRPTTLSGYGITDAATSAALSAHTGNMTNPHGVTKAQVGLGNVENTALSTWTGSSNLTTLGTIASDLNVLTSSFKEQGGAVYARDTTPNGSTYIGGGEFTASNETANQYSARIVGVWGHGKISSNATGVNIYGVYGQASASTSYSLGNGTTIAAGSFYATSTSGGTRNALVGVDANVWTLGGNTTAAYGLRSNVGYGAGTPPTYGYGLYIGDILATNQYGIYQAGEDDLNYFAGPITAGGTINNVTFSGNGSLSVAGNASVSGANTGDQDLSGYASLAGNNTFSGNVTFTGNVTMSLADTVTFQRVNIGSPDYGWRYNAAGGGQQEIVFPGGTCAFYQTGSPPRPYMYFAGTIQADYLIGSISGITINASGLTGVIPIDVIANSMATMGNWLPTSEKAGASGIPFADDPDVTGAREPAAGDYYPIMRTVVVTGNTNWLDGKYQTAVQFAASTHPSASASLDFPSIAGGGSASLTITVSGAVTTNTPTVSLGWSAALPAGIVVSHAWVSAANTVTVTLSNITGGAIDPAAVTCRASITQY